MTEFGPTPGEIEAQDSVLRLGWRPRVGDLVWLQAPRFDPRVYRRRQEAGTLSDEGRSALALFDHAYESRERSSGFFLWPTRTHAWVLGRVERADPLASYCEVQAVHWRRPRPFTSFEAPFVFELVPVHGDAGR